MNLPTALVEFVIFLITFALFHTILIILELFIMIFPIAILFFGMILMIALVLFGLFFQIPFLLFHTFLIGIEGTRLNNHRRRFS